MDVNNLFPRIRYAEWACIIVSATFQITWILTIGSMDRWHIVSTCSLVALFLIASMNAEKLSMNMRMVLMIVECLLAISAMALGSYRMYGLLFLVLAGKAAMILDRRRMLAVATLLIVAHGLASSFIRAHFVALHGAAHGGVIALMDRHPTAIVMVESQLFFICAVAISIMFGRTFLAELASRRAAEGLTREIEEMAISVERSRIARDMHDTIGHSLTSLNIQLELATKLLETGHTVQCEQALNLAREAAKSSLADVRNTVRAIREEEFSLEESVQAITDRIGKQQEISFDLEIDDKNLSSPCRHNLLMILRECLTNIQRHSQASKVTIALNASSKQAHLTVRDNGKGFELRENGTGCGIKGMEERALSLGGAVNITSEPDGGTAVVVTLPM